MRKIPSNKGLGLAAGHSAFVFMPLAKEATILIFFDDRQELTQRFDLSLWLVTVPFPICAMPIDFPHPLIFHERCLGKRLLGFLLRISPEWPDFKDLNALPFEAVDEIELISNMSGWPNSLDELGHGLFNSRNFNGGQCHSASSSFPVELKIAGTWATAPILPNRMILDGCGQ
jgi:hypothetical protein